MQKEKYKELAQKYNLKIDDGKSTSEEKEKHQNEGVEKKEFVEGNQQNQDKPKFVPQILANSFQEKVDKSIEKYHSKVPKRKIIKKPEVASKPSKKD